VATAEPIREALEHGLDLSLLIAHLERTAAERLVMAALHARDVRLLSRESDRTDMHGLMQTLTSGGVRYILIGGMAASVHGSAYVTRDLDLCYDAGPENIDRLLAVLASWGATPRDAMPESLSSEVLSTAGVIRVRTPDGDVDLFREVIGVGDYCRCRPTALEVAVDGMTVPDLGLGELIAAKRAAPPGPESGPLLSLEALRAILETGWRPWHEPVWSPRYALRTQFRPEGEGPALA